MATYHDKRGKFCPPESASLVNKGGDRFKVVRQHRRIRKKRNPRDVAEDLVQQSNRRLQRLAMLGALTAPGFVNLSDVLGESSYGHQFRWRKIEGNKITDPAEYEVTTRKGKARIRKRGRKWFLEMGKRSYEIGRSATFDKAEAVLAKVLDG